MKDCQRWLRKGRGRGTVRGLLLGCLLAFVALPPAASGQGPPPHDRYLSLSTEHFRVTFSEGLEEVARKAALVAEETHALLGDGFFPPPAGPIDLLLTDHADLSNGFAYVFPSNRIHIWIHPPLDGRALSHFDEWLEQVVIHEVAHIFHLDYTGPPGRILRAVFGRAPMRWPYFSGYSVPFLAIEGVAVHLETAQTVAGRLHGTLHEAVVRAQWLEGRAETTDQGIGSSPVWPGGDRRYVYGSLLFDYLARTRGEGAVARFLRVAADQWIPFRMDAAAREAFGESFGALWEEWMEEVAAETRQLLERIEREGRPAAPPEILTRGGRHAAPPAPGPDGLGVAYLRDDARSDVRLVLLAPDGEERTLARWNGPMSPPRWASDGRLLVPQVELEDRYRLHRDLYLVSLDGRVERLTRDLRVIHADPHPGGEGIVAVLGGEGTTRLAILTSTGEVARVLRQAEPGIQWSHPAWSPDGQRMAVVRRRPGGWTALLVLDREGRILHQVTEDRSLNLAPAWSPSGDALLWSSDRSGVPNLYGIRFGGSEEGAGELLQITDLTTAGIFPAVDPEGRWIFLSVLGADGWEVGRIPYRPEGWFRPAPADPRFLGEAAAPVRPEPGFDPADPAELEVRPYSPLPTLVPRYWLPVWTQGEWVGETQVLRDGWGIQTSGTDLIGRHGYGITATVPLRDPGSRPEWSARYRWAGLGHPVLTLESGQTWEAVGRLRTATQPEGDLETFFPVHRERFLGGAVELGQRRVRWSATLSAGGRLVRLERSLREEDGRVSRRVVPAHPGGALAEARVSAGLSNARAYPFSVSTENGIGVGLTYRERWDLSASEGGEGPGEGDGAFRELVGSLRGYRGVPGPGHANHVLALRLAGGVAEGAGAGAGHFGIGGAHRFFPVRGERPGALRGQRAWSLSGEWRFPLRILHRGLGAWPVHLDRLAGSVFVDAAGGGSAPGSGEGGWVTRSAFGGELVLSHSFFFGTVERFRVGLAIPLGSSAARPSFHAGSGWSF